MINKQFEDKLKNIFYHVAKYGTISHASECANLEDFDNQRFFELCNEGYKIAQIEILTELRVLQRIISRLKNNLKRERIRRNKSEIEILISKIKVEEYKEELLRNLAFTIVWYILNGRKEIIARFYTGEKGNNELSGKGFNAIVEASADINKDKEKFALISDLTNNIQIGDLLVIHPNKLEIVEIKTGKKNEEAIRILNFYKINNLILTKDRLEKSFDTNFAKQVLRMRKQKEKTERATKILETDEGDDPKYDDTFVKLLDSPITDETYHQEIIDLLDKLKEKDWAYTNIMGCINIGVYKDDWRVYGKFILKKTNNDYPVYDLMSTLGITISEPIFAKPFPDDAIIDIALGRIKVYIGIDLDQFIKLSNNLGLSMRWSTRRELHKLLDKLSIDTKEILTYNNKGLIFEDEDTKSQPMFVGQGMIGKMLFDHVKPHTLIMNRKIGFEQFKKEVLNKK